MLKATKTFSLDVDVVEELQKEKNQSLLINSYLRNYFNLDKKSLGEVEKDDEVELNKEIKGDFNDVFKGN